MRKEIEKHRPQAGWVPYSDGTPKNLTKEEQVYYSLLQAHPEENEELPPEDPVAATEATLRQTPAETSERRAQFMAEVAKQARDLQPDRAVMQNKVHPDLQRATAPLHIPLIR